MRLGDPSPLQVARGLFAVGLQVLPAALGAKSPKIEWRKWQDRRADDMVSRWFGGSACNFWVMTGRISGIVVVDCDTQAGHDFWLELIPDLDETARVESRPGRHHHWYTVPKDWDRPIKSWSIHPLDVPPENVTQDLVSFDVKADGGGVLAPPSVHPETGLAYRWLVPLSEAREAPRKLLDGGWYRQHGRSRRPQGGAAGTTPAQADGQPKSLLARLLTEPPGEGGRNDWLTRVAGHYAKQFRTQHDMYELSLIEANRRLETPLPDDEFQKIADSIWRAEHDEAQGLAKVGEANGYMVGDGELLRTQIQEGRGENAMLVLDVCTDFDMKAEGIMTSPEGWRTYWITLTQRDQRTQELRSTDLIIKGEVFGDDRKLRALLARYAATFSLPPTTRPTHMGMGIRLQRYLEYQQPPVVTVTDVLGWDSEIMDGRGGFVTHEHVITATEVMSVESAGVRPDPGLMSGKLAPHRYGFRGTWEEAQWVLNEVLSFQEETVTSVFGAWWAACIMKPQVMERAALFPFMAIEAPSESGKTNGFFEMMIQMNGNWVGEQQPTKAALRDMMAAHHSGIVWVDDLDDPAYLGELLRASTSGGSVSKLGEDKKTLASAKIIAPLVMSGESLGMSTQKALIDRAIPLQVSSPVGRRSRRDSSRPQWDDVLALRERFPMGGERFGLADIAGWFVQVALSAQDQFNAALKRGKLGGAGRSADKDGVLRAGACLLDYLCGADGAWEDRGPHYAYVDAWLKRSSRRDGVSAENTLTLKVLPEILRVFEWPTKALKRTQEKQYGAIDTPAFVRTDIMGKKEMWFCASFVAAAWHITQHGFIDRRTESYDAIMAQAKAMKCERKQMKLIGGKGDRAYYYRVPDELVQIILDRSQGGD